MSRLLRAAIVSLLNASGITAGALQGTLVEDGSGNAVPRALVRAFAASNNAPVAEAQTDANGRFALGIPSMRGYVLRMSKRGYIGVEVAVSDALPNPLRVRMPKLATFEGQVRQADGAAVRGASVVGLWRPSGSSVSTRMVTASSDDSGRFRIADLPPGYYKFACAAHLTVSGALAFVLAYPDRTGDREISVGPGDQLTDTFTPAASTRFHLYGRNAAAGPGHFHLFNLGPPDVLALTSGSADGTFRFEGLPAGLYQLIEDSPGGESANGGVTIRLNGDMEGVVSAPSGLSVVPLTVDLPETCGPEATVVVERLLTLADYVPAVRTNVVRGKSANLTLAPGSYRVTARNKDGQCMSLADTGLRVGGDGTAPAIRAVLSRKTMVLGTVSKSAPHQSVGVVLMPLSGVEPLLLRVAATAEDGRFVFSDVLPGNYLAAARLFEDQQARWLTTDGSKFSISGTAMTIDVNQH
jgi:hypothetical protein